MNVTKETSGLSPRVMPLTSNNNIKHIPFAFDLISLLPKSHQTELLFSLLIQDLAPSLNNPYDWYPGTELISGKSPSSIFRVFLYYNSWVYFPLFEANICQRTKNSYWLSFLDNLGDKFGSKLRVFRIFLATRWGRNHSKTPFLDSQRAKT